LLLCYIHVESLVLSNKRARTRIRGNLAAAYADKLDRQQPYVSALDNNALWATLLDVLSLSIS
jgi:hypothetical protein